MKLKFLLILHHSKIPNLLVQHYFKLWPWNFKVKVMGVVKEQGHIVVRVSNWFASFSFRIDQTNNSWDTAISKFGLEKSKIKVMGEVKSQGHIVYPVFNWCTSFSFHVNQINHCWDMVNRVFDLEKNTSEILNKKLPPKKFQKNLSKI